MKGKRQEKILEIIRTNDIETQEELTKKLSEAGFSSTQGTVSRDIRELKLTKVTGANGRQKYAPIQAEDIHVSSKYKRVLSEGILHMDNRFYFSSWSAGVYCRRRHDHVCGERNFYGGRSHEGN